MNWWTFIAAPLSDGIFKSIKTEGIVRMKYINILLILQTNKILIFVSPQDFDRNFWMFSFLQ